MQLAWAPAARAWCQGWLRCTRDGGKSSFGAALGQTGVGKGLEERCAGAGESDGELKVILHWEGWRRSVSMCACLVVRVCACASEKIEN